MVQWVERRTEKPVTTLIQVRLPGAARDFSPSVSFQNQNQNIYCPSISLQGNSHTLSVQPPCAVAGINVELTLKILNTGGHWRVGEYIPGYGRRSLCRIVYSKHFGMVACRPIVKQTINLFVNTIHSRSFDSLKQTIL